MNKRFTILLGIIVLLLGGVLFFRFSDGAAGLLWGVSKQGQWLLPLVAVTALIDSVNPCAFSILLLTIAFLFGVGRSRRDIMKIGGVYVAGIFAAYFLIGLGILQALHLFNAPHFMAKIGAVLLVVLGLISVMNEYVPSFHVSLRIPHAAHAAMSRLMEQATVPTALALGLLVGLCEFPCTGGPYLLVLGLLHDRGTYVSGLGYLILYNVIFVLPLILILMVASSATLVERVKAWQQKERFLMRVGGGVVMVVLGLLILLL
jgi:cytochrome c biogenesis protein CcdA